MIREKPASVFFCHRETLMMLKRHGIVRGVAFKFTWLSACLIDRASSLKKNLLNDDRFEGYNVSLKHRSFLFIRLYHQ